MRKMSVKDARPQFRTGHHHVHHRNMVVLTKIINAFSEMYIHACRSSPRHLPNKIARVLSYHDPVPMRNALSNPVHTTTPGHELGKGAVVGFTPRGGRESCRSLRPAFAPPPVVWLMQRAILIGVASTNQRTAISIVIICAAIGTFGIGRTSQVTFGGACQDLA
jgi:hypothetical protein